MRIDSKHSSSASSVSSSFLSRVSFVFFPEKKKGVRERRNRDISLLTRYRISEEERKARRKKQKKEKRNVRFSYLYDEKREPTPTTREEKVLRQTRTRPEYLRLSSKESIRRERDNRLLVTIDTVFSLR